MIHQHIVQTTEWIALKFRTHTDIMIFQNSTPQGEKRGSNFCMKHKDNVGFSF